MKHTSKIISVVLLLAMLFSVCGCNSSNKNEPKTIALEAEVSVRNTIVTITSEEEIFNKNISLADLEIFVQYTGEEKETEVKADNLMCKSQKKVIINFIIEREIETVKIRVKSSGTQTKEECLGMTKDIIRYSNGTGEQDIPDQTSTPSGQ